MLCLLAVTLPHPPAVLPHKSFAVKRAPLPAVDDRRGDGKMFFVDRAPRSARAITSIHLIGERHSGTKWMTRHLEECFGHQVKVLNRYTRYKHWFQYDDADSREPNSALVVAMFRDPYDWLDSMRGKPYHSPNHFDLDWKGFVTTPWTMARGTADRLLLASGAHRNATCMHRFSFEEVVPCSPSDRNMYNATYRGRKVGIIYELRHDGAGTPYESVAGLRRDKIANFLDVARFRGVATLAPVQFEFLVSRGTRALIGEIEDLTGVRARCDQVPPQPLRVKNLDPEFVEWVTANVDWEVEELVGYTQRR